jgi:hypothetical protein
MQLFHKFITLWFICRSICFGRLYAHHQELTTALTASGFTVGALVVAALLLVVWLVITSSSWWAWRRPKHVEWHINHQVINLWNRCIYLDDLFELYDDARTCPRQIDKCTLQQKKSINFTCAKFIKFTLQKIYKFYFHKIQKPYFKKNQ